MSSASLKAYANLTGARRTLQRIRDGLRLVAGGAVADEAAQEIGAAYRKIVDEKYAKHRATGALVGSAHVDVDGSLVQIGRYGYARYHRWDPLRRGSVPPFMLKIAQQIASAKLLAAVRGDSSFVRTPAAVGVDEAEDVEREVLKEETKTAAKAAAKFKKDIARIYRSTPEYKAKKAAERRAARKAKAGGA